MSTVIKEIYIDITNKSFITININQYEKNTRFVKVYCTNEGEFFPILKNNCIIVRYAKPDGNLIICNAQPQNDGTILLEVTEQMATSDGLACCEFQIINVNDSSVLCTTTFNIKINKSSADDKTIASSSEFKSLSDLIMRVENALINEDELKETLEQAKDYMDSAADSSNKSKEFASNAKASETNAKLSESNAKLSETNAKSSESNSSASATKSSDSAMLSESNAKGGTNSRTEEDTDNAKYYYEKAKEITGTDNFVLKSSVGAASGVASLDSNRKVPNTQMPNYATSSTTGGPASSALSCTGNSATATKSTQDSSGQQITSTYIKGLSASGKTITYTKGDNTSGTITTQDTVYTHPTTSGNKHIPSGGSSNQILAWNADGTAKWADNEVLNIAKGRNQSLAYATYKDMITALNALKTGELNVGQNIYIGAVGVPDLWVYATYAAPVSYPYTSDDAMISKITNDKYLQIGYYAISMLETQKVDLSDVNSNISSLNAKTIQNTTAINTINTKLENISTLKVSVKEYTINVTSQSIHYYGGISFADQYNNIVNSGHSILSVIPNVKNSNLGDISLYCGIASCSDNTIYAWAEKSGTVNVTINILYM